MPILFNRLVLTPQRAKTFGHIVHYVAVLTLFMLALSLSHPGRVDDTPVCFLLIVDLEVALAKGPFPFGFSCLGLPSHGAISDS